jgi:hypothetical protein
MTARTSSVRAARKIAAKASTEKFDEFIDNEDGAISDKRILIRRKNMETKFELFRELIELSLNEKRGLTIYFNGQSIAGVVKNITGNETLELRNQMFSRIIVRVETIEAVAIG